jgi:hypothetical protein
MISRRTILAWLGLAPFAIAATKLPAAQIDTLDTVTGTRQRWKTILNPDGSSDLVKGDKRWLDAWIEDRKTHVIGPSDTMELEMVEANHQAEVLAMEERSNPWRELKEFEDKYEREVPVEIKIYDKGEYMPWDPCAASKNGIRTVEWPPKTLTKVVVQNDKGEVLARSTNGEITFWREAAG